MKKEIVKMLALLLFGAAALSSCAIDNHRHGRHYNDRHNGRGHNNGHNGYHDRDNNLDGYNRGN